MKNGKVTICIGTVGSPTFEKCKNTIYKHFKGHRLVEKIVIIKDKSPQSAWLNEMKRHCTDTEWCLQVDEDMYLRPNALDELINLYKLKESKGIKILNASSLLYDLFLERNIGSLKLWNSEALQKLEFRDVLGGDRDFAKRASKLGFKNVETSLVLGKHDSAPTAAVAFSKYFEYVQKIQKFSGKDKAVKFVNFLKNKYEKDKSNFINKKAYDGGRIGLNKTLKDRSKRSSFKKEKKDIFLNITTYNRPKSLYNLLLQINSEYQKISKDYNIHVYVTNDSSKKDYSASISFLKKKKWKYYFLNKNLGKKQHWILFNRCLNEIKKDFKIKQKNDSIFVFLQDDNIITNDFFKKIIDMKSYILKDIESKNFAINMFRDDSTRDGIARWIRKRFVDYKQCDLCYFVDGMFCCDKKTLDAISWKVDKIELSRWDKEPQLSSGVFHQITKKINTSGLNIYMPKESFIQQTDGRSVMHPWKKENIKSLNFKEK